ncbi:MAG TPA: glycosyltransferase family 87 protein, partial [Acidobacteriaceae bacterium]|nr:glycosyltransferase family 87 protein [Acidobacteriaceae bacterium]
MQRFAFAHRWIEGDARLTNAALCLLGFALVRLAQQFGFEIGRFWIGFEDVALLSALVYLGAVLIVRTQPVNRATLWIVVGFAVAMHAMTFLVDPFLSSDMYRYVWDGMVQHHGISPYRYVPGDPVLSWLRAPNQEIFDNINRRDYARTIYPPVAQMVYWLAAWFAPTVDAMKLTMLAFEGLAAWALVKLLERWGRPAAEVLLLLWCPLLVWEIGNAAHVDAVVIGFVGLALLFRWRERPWLTGLFLGCAVMTKFYPLVLFPALWQRRDWRMPTAVVAVVAVGYALYARVGWLVFGFLGGYQKEEGMESGTRYFPLEFARTRMGMPWLPNTAYYALCAVVMGAIVWWCWRQASVERPAHPDGQAVGTQAAPGVWVAPAYVRGAGALAFAMMLLFSPHYPWYVIWLVPFLVLSPSLPMYTYVLGLWFGLTTG